MNWFKGYAECNKCKEQEGPWILVGQKFLCENCFEKYREEINKSIIKNKKGIENENKRNTNTGRNE